MGFVISRSKNLSLFFSLVILLCSHAKSFAENQGQEAWNHAGEFALNDQEKQYIQMYPEDKFAYIPYEVLAPLTSVLEKNKHTFTDPSFSSVYENLKNHLRISRYSDIEKVVDELHEDSLSTYKQQLKNGDAVINVIFDKPITRGCCNPCSARAASCRLVLSQPSLTALQVLQILVALQSLQNEDGSLVLQGLQGIPGLAGLQGIPGLQGIIGLQGIPGIAGIQGLQGLLGLQGIQGPAGTSGIDGVISSAQYVQLGAQPGSIAAGQPFTYTTAVLTTPNIIASTGIFGSFTASGTVFQLTNIGRYEVNYQMTFPTDGGVDLYTSPSLNGTYSPLPYTMIGKTPDGQIAGSVIVETTTANSFIAVVAAAGNAAAIQPGPNSSTTNQNATTVSFKQIA
jgi:hypothetical protein